MKSEDRFRSQPKQFWAYVRSISEKIGYTGRAKDGKPSQILAPSYEKMREALTGLSLDPNLIGSSSTPNVLGEALLDYFKYRADLLNGTVEGLLMDVQDAKKMFEDLRVNLEPQCKLPLNKQKGEKSGHAYLTGIVNMLVEQSIDGLPCNFDPGQLTTFTANGSPLRTLARRVDGAFPGVINPIVIWEIKEYYYTTTFGSRVAGGVYETLLDGMELEELLDSENIQSRHLLIVDSHFTWWGSGKSYLCRMIDMLNMGYVDDILFGREVLEELPKIMRECIEIYQSRNT